MIHISDKCRCLLYSGETDMRKSFQGLARIVKQEMKCDVLNGDIYVFLSKRRNRIKLLRFEGDGYAIYYKRLEKGTFEMPKYDNLHHTMLVTDNELMFILKGVALKKVKYRPRYSHFVDPC
jgi:transposase